MDGIKLTVFLGNPGNQYAGNRHNAGRLFSQNIVEKSAWQKKFKGLYANITLGEVTEKIHLLMPETFMNLSGASVKAAAAFFRLQPQNILIVHDELELDLGQASFKFSGGLGGHNGLRSAKEQLGTADFWRLRIGIGRPYGIKEAGQDISGWVLSNFTADEKPLLDEVFTVCTQAFYKALLDGPQTLLPQWNKKTICTRAAS
ncbi:peptidyl-tRNA hydrolase [Spirochaetia bacterium]|nr:peptidyl-tRNA hydrolase [Spirochaetia bacterium]